MSRARWLSEHWSSSVCPRDSPVTCWILGERLRPGSHHLGGGGELAAQLYAALDRETEGDLLLGDMGQGIPFRPGSFDGCISISAVQWLCNANKKSDIPAKRLYCFFSSLYSALVRGARAVLQLYPENSEQLELITTQATRAGFTGGVVVDYPNSAKAKKFYLCLFSGPSASLPKGLSASEDGEEATESKFTKARVVHGLARRGMLKKSREWVLEKKARRRRQGKEVRPDTQYTGRKRRPRF
ncbi:probable 18S rRNA (guanine-N(7))-methyltransferase isoform X3 [Cavia porcellus]|uniref:probable 18S rRNA (guanine-N(7))-methyltransferase isoform X3 n=1 Tax=Cavia porcellus TaxID=10141 RepID=UPI000661C40B|nr:probable 18S rRNA (guanine-N(7))-methyltransferase isoform X3 [Cavia porcellus]XP_013008181.1 probable 18S rRNA (guanine-N(7))-methyltransferase isoform X3 [Cavia porcellus]